MTDQPGNVARKQTGTWRGMTPEEMARVERETGKSFGGVWHNLPPQVPTGYEAGASLQDIPNYERLTGFERTVMNALPGIPVPVQDALRAFGEGPLGRVLSVIDIGAEALERATGFTAQFLATRGTPDQADFDRNWRSAWYAGSLAADAGDAPLGTLTPYTIGGGVVGGVLGSLAGPGIGTAAGAWAGAAIGTELGLGIRIATDGGESVAAMASARSRIEELVSGGMDFQEALAQARGEMYGDAGALQLRSQLNDAWVHIFADPVNVLFSWIRPVEAVRRGAQAAEIGTRTPEALAEAGADVARLEEALAALPEVAAEQAPRTRITELQDLVAARLGLPVTREAPTEIAERMAWLQRVEAGMNTEEAAEVAALKAAEVAGGGTAAQRLNIAATGAEAEARRALGEQLESARNVLRIAEATPPATPRQELLMRVSGLMEWPEGSVARRFFENPVGRVLASPFRLTPLARAHESIDNAMRAIGSLIGDAGVEETARMLRRAADGVLDPQVAHMIVTPAGRYLRANMTAVAAVAEDVAAGFAEAGTTARRGLVELMATALGQDIHTVYRRLGTEAPAVLDTAQRAIRGSPELTALTQRFLQSFGYEEITVDMLRGAHEAFQSTFKRTGVFLYADDLAGIGMRNRMIDSVAQLAVGQFGLEDRGVLLAAADALKAAESLAFLRLNPGYPIRNWINNYMTMLRDGSFGTFSLGWTDELWRRVGWQPEQLRAGVGMGGFMGEEVTPVLGRGLLRQAERAETGAAGWFEGVRDMFSGVHPPVDFGRFAQQIEVNASRRAYTTGYLRFYGSSFRGLMPRIAEYSPELAAELGEDAARAIEHALPQAMNGAELDAVALTDNINLLWGPIRQRASRILGSEISDTLGEEFLETIAEDISRAASRGPGAITDAMRAVRGRVQDHLDGLVDRALRTMVDETEALVTTEGPGALPRVYGYIVDDLYAAQHQHMTTMGRLGEVTPDWETLLADEQRLVDRSFLRAEARMQGAANGARSVLRRDPGSRQVLASFREWRDTWRQFFASRNTAFREFYGTARESRTITWDALRAQINSQYDEALALEQRLLQQIDDTAGAMMPVEQQAVYAQWRGMLADLRTQDRELTRQWFRKVDGIPLEERAGRYTTEYWRPRLELNSQMHQVERAGLAAMQGDPNAQAILMQLAEAERPAAQAVEAAAPALEAVAEVAPTAERAFLTDFGTFVPRELYMGTGVEELWFTRGDDVMEAIQQAALELRRERPIRFADLSETAQAQLRGYLDHAHTVQAQARYAGMRGGEWTRDAALLNYNRRHNYNTWLGALAPYEFWFTSSVAKWALHSLDRPAMLSTFLRMRQFLDTAFRPESGLPDRLRGTVRIPMPFMPEWMGDSLFVDPIRWALPLDQFFSGPEVLQRQQATDAGAAMRILEQLRNDGQISEQEYQQASTEQGGPVWERAMSLVRQDDAEGRSNVFDTLALFANPHAPLMWAFTNSEEEGPFLPITRSIRTFTAGLGIGPAGGVNIEGSIRRALGLPEYDRWDDYRTDRMLSDMVADGTITLQQSREAMVERTGEVYEEAVRRAGIQFAGGGALSGAARFFGLPVQGYPTGEEHQRELTDAYAGAWDAYDAGDTNAIDEFFQEHPEYQARVDLGYWDKPDDRLRRFLVGDLWDRYHSLSDLNRQEVVPQLGAQFEQAFLNPETRNTGAIPLETLAVWLRQMGGEFPGTLGAGAVPLEMAPPAIAGRAQVFYDLRDAAFPDYRRMQDDYFRLDEGGARRVYLTAHPRLQQYWNWRNDWLLRNPDVAEYLDDNPPTYPSERALREAEANQPNFTAQEWQGFLGTPLWNLVVDWGQGEELPAAGQDRIREIAEGLGITYQDALQRIVSSMALAPQ